MAWQGAGEERCCGGRTRSRTPADEAIKQRRMGSGQRRLKKGQGVRGAEPGLAPTHRREGCLPARHNLSTPKPTSCRDLVFCHLSLTLIFVLVLIPLEYTSVCTILGLQVVPHM